jgi:hypothetical protein
MLNRIRRAVSHTSERYLHKGRHRRPLTSARPMAAPPGSPDGPMPFLGQRRECADALVGEETALVRPYVLAIEERTRQPSTAGPHPLPADTWFTAAGAS